MSRRAYAIAAVSLSGLVVLSLLGAPVASAYPPGKEQRTTLNKTEVRTDGRFKARVRNAQPGCRVTFTVVNSDGRTVDSRVGTVGSNGRTQREFSPAPSRPGTYTVVATVSGRDCKAETSQSTIRVNPRG